MKDLMLSIDYGDKRGDKNIFAIARKEGEDLKIIKTGLIEEFDLKNLSSVENIYGEIEDVKRFKKEKKVKKPKKSK